MGKIRKSLFPDYRGFKGEHVRDLMDGIFKNIPLVFEDDLADSLDEEGVHAENETVEIQNLNQEWLCAYLDGNIDFHANMIDAYLDETNADSPNYDLFYRYFRRGAPTLKRLLLACIDRYPSDPALLNDLAYAHEYAFMLEDLANCYRRACLLESDPEGFAELAEGYFFNTIPDDFDAFYDLHLLFQDDPQKLAIVEYLLEHLGLDDTEAPERLHAGAMPDSGNMLA
ncbi:hypothetical protein [Desulfatirhabdium butyrativorans]|uniref:hypothetical protein n=1 Tax=Desulfatirhabdium butyrativorans TaxID=340467 RepID=UPI0004895F0C|nr:hypothetical protein [Desulfatirhabdium butyrativorans]